MPAVPLTATVVAEVMTGVLSSESAPLSASPTSLGSGPATPNRSMPGPLVSVTVLRLSLIWNAVDCGWLAEL